MIPASGSNDMSDLVYRRTPCSYLTDHTTRQLVEYMNGGERCPFRMPFLFSAHFSFF